MTDKYEVFIEVAGEQIIVPYSILEDVLNCIPDSKVEATVKFFMAVAGHPSSDVRAALSSREDLPEHLYVELANDADPIVLNAISRNRTAVSFLNTNKLSYLLTVSTECAKNIASNFDSIENADNVQIMNELLEKKDPAVRLFLAENSSTPKKILRILLNDSDVSVRNAAERTLNY